MVCVRGVAQEGGRMVEVGWSRRKGKQRRCGKLRAIGGGSDEPYIEVATYLFRQTGRRSYSVRHQQQKKSSRGRGRGSEGVEIR